MSVSYRIKYVDTDHFSITMPASRRRVQDTTVARVQSRQNPAISVTPWRFKSPKMWPSVLHRALPDGLLTNAHGVTSTWIFSNTAVRTSKWKQICHRGGIFGCGTAPQAGWSRVRFPTGQVAFCTQFFRPHYGPGVDAALTQMSTEGISWGVKAAGA
jgi:hypothetical protein